jgi:hypothetical protein
VKLKPDGEPGGGIELSRYARWMMRAGQESFFSWGELWADKSGSAEYADWEALARQRGLDPTETNIKYHATRGLLSELLYAAGGVEQELLRLERAVAEAQRWTDEARKLFPPRNPEEIAAGAKSFSGAPTLLDASYAFNSVMIWARAVCERIERPYKPNHKERVGLLPALSPEGSLRDRIQRAFDRLKAEINPAVRFMANYSLHAGTLTGGSTPTATTLDDGKIKFAAPDPPSDPIATWEVFTYDESRDQLGHTREVMDAIEHFVDETLTAFEENIPHRVQPGRG